MKRFAMVLLVAVMVVVAALIRAAQPPSTGGQVVPSVIGQLTVLNTSTSLKVTGVAVTTTLTGQVEDVAPSADDCFLVAQVDAVFVGKAFGNVDAAVTSGGKTFEPQGLMGVTLAEPGFTTHSTVPIVIPKNRLVGARLQFQTGAVIHGYQRTVEVDLGLTADRVAQLLESAGTPIAVDLPRTEVTP